MLHSVKRLVEASVQSSPSGALRSKAFPLEEANCQSVDDAAAAADNVSTEAMMTIARIDQDPPE